MRIAIDAHSVGTQLAGNATYITSMIEALAEIDRDNEYTLYVTLPSAVERFHGRWDNFTVRRTMPHTPLIRIPITLTAELRLRPVDVLFVQFTAPPFAPCKVVTSIHDISYEHIPETFKWRSRMQMKLTIRQTARTADHIVTCSEYSRQDIIDTYKIAREKVSTILLAAPEFFHRVDQDAEKERVKKKYDLPDEFVLGVGSIQPRKNLPRLFEAYAELSKRRDLPPLILVGKKAWLFEETMESVNAIGIGDKVRFTGFVPDEDLAALYSLASVFVYPSFFEGFGLPPLEAMKCGTPVITGNLTSLPEVVGDAGIMVDPYNTTSIADAIERVITDADLRRSMSEKGYAQAAKFSWAKTARETLDVLERTVKSK